MKAISSTSASAPDRQFLLWILLGLIAATVVSGTTALAVALATSSVP